MDNPYRDARELGKKIAGFNSSDDRAALFTFFKLTPQGQKMWRMIEEDVIGGIYMGDNGTDGLIAHEAIRQFFSIWKNEIESYTIHTTQENIHGNATSSE